ncbi:TetR/AcrR family transcriptional regulator [Parahaliea maris]|nr:TetR/AcrR family transcriptional regulator [Parahaliea maris]
MSAEVIEGKHNTRKTTARKKSAVKSGVARKKRASAKVKKPSASTGKMKKRETVDSILIASEEVLLSVGYSGLTARKVAEEAGIAVGNLTYHFPSMKKLHLALIENVLGRYLKRWEDFLEEEPAGDVELYSIREVLDWLITDAIEPRTARLFRELWAMAEHSSADAALMDDFYRQTTEAAAKVLRRRCFPQLSEAEAMDLAYFMGVLSEGSIVLFGTLPDSKQRVASFKRHAIISMESLTGHLHPES